MEQGQLAKEFIDKLRLTNVVVDKIIIEDKDVDLIKIGKGNIFQPGFSIKT